MQHPFAGILSAKPIPLSDSADLETVVAGLNKGGNRATTLALGEEGGSKPPISTRAFGEE